MDNNINPYDGLLDPLGFGEGRATTPAEEAKANDRRLELVVLYLVTKGYTDMPPSAPSTGMLLNAQADPKAMNEISELTKKKSEYTAEVNRLFKQFKNMIMRGDMKLDELEKRIYSRYGIGYDGCPATVEDGLDTGDIEFMSEKEYSLMRESYDGQEGTEETKA